MVDKEFVLKYVNKNYDLGVRKYSVDDKYSVIDLITGQEFFGLKDFIDSFRKIIPCEGLGSILIKWFEDKCDIKDKILIDYIKTLKLTKGINVLIEETTKHFKDDKTFNVNFLVSRTNEIYVRHYIQPKLDRFYKKMDTSLTSNKWLSKFSYRIYGKNEFVKTYIQKGIIQHYLDNVLPGKVNDFLESMDLSHGSIFLCNDLVNTMMGDLENYHGYIVNTFDNYYRKNHLDKVIKDYIKTLNTNMNSQFIVDNFKQLAIEISTHYDYCIDKVNEWYGEVVLKDKIDDLLSQLIITLGNRNWVVRWIGHGILTEDKLCESFREHNYHKSYILKKYDEWYSTAVIAASEREVLKNKGEK
jgi:hypothetical protein